MPKLLWANMQCLVDNTSGASLSIRNALKQLANLGWDIRILGATCFDHRSGIEAFPERERYKLFKPEKFTGLKVKDGPITHDLINTNEDDRDNIQARYEQAYFKTFQEMLSKFSPDLLWAYGGRPLDCVIASDAKRSGAVTASYLVNGGYYTTRWARDYDTIITDSNKTKQLYKERLNLDLTKIGKFLDTSQLPNTKSLGKDILIINPSPEKGGILIVQVAYDLIKRGRAINFRVAQSRGDLLQVIEAVCKHYGVKKDFFNKVFINQGTLSDMKEFYSNGRVLFAPSFWYESGSRALAEATVAGIPVITTDSGGNREMTGDTGTVIKMPPIFYEKPFNKILPEENVRMITDAILRYFDDEGYYELKSASARKYGQAVHQPEKSAVELDSHFQKLIANNVRRSRL